MVLGSIPRLVTNIHFAKVQSAANDMTASEPKVPVF